MYISKRIEKMKDFQSIFIDYFDNKHHSEENYQQISKIFSSHDIQTNKLELKPFLYLIQKNSITIIVLQTFSKKCSKSYLYYQIR